MTEFAALIKLLAQHQVTYLIVGGMAATVHGSSRLTLDLDIVYERSQENLRRLVDALTPINPYLRGAPPGLPFKWSLQTLKMGQNFTLSTALGPLDLFGEIMGGGNYTNLIETSIEIELFGVSCRCIGLHQLILAKRAAGRPKDFETLAELEAIYEEKNL